MIFSESYDLFKNPCSMVTQIYAIRDGGISVTKTFFGNGILTTNEAHGLSKMSHDHSFVGSTLFQDPRHISHRNYMVIASFKK